MTCILVIDDEPALRAAVCEVLTDAGYEVIEAQDGREGLRVCQACPVDLVLTDLLMPEQDGFAPLLVLQTQHPTIKCIAMSGGGAQSNPNLVHMAALLGAHHILPRPIWQQALLDAVRVMLSTGDAQSPGT